MYVCVCKAISDRTIHRAIDTGTADLRGLCRQLGAGSVCGRCVPEMRSLLAARSPSGTANLSSANLDAAA